jgi:hypothetical protein
MAVSASFTVLALGKYATVQCIKKCIWFRKLKISAATIIFF